MRCSPGKRGYSPWLSSVFALILAGPGSIVRRDDHRYFVTGHRHRIPLTDYVRREPERFTAFKIAFNANHCCQDRLFHTHLFAHVREPVVQSVNFLRR